MDDFSKQLNQKPSSSSALVEVLDRQVKVYRSLLDVVRKEKEILISADLDELNENNRSKEKMILKLRSLEAQRVKLAVELGSDFGVQPEDARLIELARVIGGETGDRLRSLHSVLDLLLRRVHEHNKENEALVQSALSHINGAMKAIKDTLKEKPTYRRQGAVKTQDVESGQLVQKEV